MFHRNGKKKKKIIKVRIIKGINGSISILLCLLLTPFLSVTLGLVEYARYQEVLEITDEIYELTGISVLSDYDKYIHDRFGLLSTTQENTLGSGADALLQTNAGILGNQISVSNPSFTGKFSLANTEVLRRQVVDFSELTATTAVLAEDFNLEELLEKLQGVSQFQDIMNTLDGMSDFADALGDAVDALDDLKTAVTNLQTSITTATTNANTLASDFADLFKKLGDNGITLPESATLEQIEAAVSAFTADYLDDFKALYTEANTLVGSLNNIKSNLDSVKTAAGSFVTAVNNAKTAADSLTTSNSADSGGAISAAAQQTLSDVLDELTDLVDGALSDIKDDTINAAKDALNEIIDTAIEEVGLAGFTDRYASIVSGDYFSLPLSDVAKQDLTDLLKTVGELYSAQDPDNIASGLLNFFKSKFVPSININVGTLLSRIEGVIENATDALQDQATNRVISLLTDLVNILKKLFDLDLFYEADLNAYVNIGSASSSPYQSFLDAIGDLFTAIDDFKDAMSEGGLFSKLIGALGAIGDMFSAMWDLMNSIFSIASAAIDSIAELGNSIVSGDVQGLYEKLLISGYMRHNLPCRLNSGTWVSGTDGGSPTIKISLTGSGLTGYSYDNIARPAAYSGQTNSTTGFTGMAQVIQNLKNGSGTDKMFKGAELEYIRAGTNSEIANQIIVFFDLYFLRLLLDLPSVFMDAEVGSVAAAATVASWVVYILYIIAEPFCDTLLLVNGEEIPLLRSDCWLTATGVGSFISKLGSAVLGEALQNEMNNFTSEYVTNHSGSGGSGVMDLDYQSHVLILLFIFVDSDTQISRLQGLIELETAEYYRQQGKPFNMSQTYTAVEIAADVTFNPFFDLGTLTGGSPLLPSKKITQTVSY